MKKTILFFLIVGSSQLLFGQSAFTVDESSTVAVKGTSTLHDWESKTQTINGTYLFNPSILGKKFPSSGSIVEEVKIVIPVTSIKSERGDAMNNKTHNAFKYEANPDIIFTVTSDEIAAPLKDDQFELNVKGDLTMAGHTEPIEIILSGTKVSNSQFRFTCSKPINMTTFNMVPPSAMFGQIKTGEEVTIVFDLLLNSN